jgi:hypothetical protein
MGLPPFYKILVPANWVSCQVGQSQPPPGQIGRNERSETLT